MNVDGLLQDQAEAIEATGVVSQSTGRVPWAAVAYFSMEFMLSEALAYLFGRAGQCGGDQLKAN